MLYQFLTILDQPVVMETHKNYFWFFIQPLREADSSNSPGITSFRSKVIEGVAANAAKETISSIILLQNETSLICYEKMSKETLKI